MPPKLEDIASEIAYYIFEHQDHEVSTPELLADVILEKLKEIDF